MQCWNLQRRREGPAPSPRTAAGETWLLTHSASLQFLPAGHASSLSTIPVFSSATGDGWLYTHRALLHPTPNLHSAVEVGLSGIGPLLGAAVGFEVALCGVCAGAPPRVGRPPRLS